MLATEPARGFFGSATCMLAHRPCVDSMLDTETLRARTGWATWMLAHPVASMLDTETVRDCFRGATSRATWG